MVTMTRYDQSLKEARAVARPRDGSFVPALRRRAYERFKALDFPTRKMEAWKYLDLEAVLGASFAETRRAARADWDRGALEEFLLPETAQSQVVLVNGFYSKRHSGAGPLPAGVVLEDLSDSLDSRTALLEKFLGIGSESESNPFAAINTYSFRSGVFLYIPDKVIVENPVHIVSLTAPENQAPCVSYPRICVVAGASTRLKLILNEVGLGTTAYHSNSVVEVHLAPGACVKFHHLQRSAGPGTVFTVKRYYLGAHGDLEALTFTCGGALARNDSEVFFEGEHGFASLKGLGVLSGGTRVHNHVTVHHKKPHGISRQFYKNVLADSAKVEFSSLVRVYPGAIKSDSKQLNKNLLLSDQAEATSRPRLEINADDVSCQHGAAVGRMDDDELFYLQSRGLTKDEGRFLLTYGFVEEILEDVEPAGLKAQLEKLVKATLSLRGTK